MTTKAIVEAAAAIVLLSSDAIKANQDGIRKSIMSLDADVHSNAVQCLLHAETHGDTSLFTRLLVDILDDKTGYRRQGLINWMRLYSPMELSGKTINLKGVDDDGNKRPFKVAEAAANPFYLDARNAERVAKPVFQKDVLKVIERQTATTLDAIANTANGKPVDATKPYYPGKHADKVLEFFEAIQKMAKGLPDDVSKELFQAQQRLAKEAEKAQQAA